MAFTNIGTNSSATASNAASISITLAQTVTVGNTLIVIMCNTGGALGTQSATASGNAMTSIGVAGQTHFKIYKLENCPAGVTQATVNFGATIVSNIVLAAEFSPTNGNDVVSDTMKFIVGTPWTTNTIVTTVDNDLLIVLGQNVVVGSATWTVDSPAVIAIQASLGIALSCFMAWVSAGAAGNQTVTGTSSDASHSMGYAIVSLKPPSGVVPPIVFGDAYYDQFVSGGGY